jgi:ribonuclease VapC
MIAVDTSALMAILVVEPKEADCLRALRSAKDAVISAGTLAEALVVAAGRNVSEDMQDLIDALPLRVVEVTPDTARRIGGIYAKWGKGIHPAGLNFGDCFAYDVAKQNACPLLFVGNDFSLTDIESAL